MSARRPARVAARTPLPCIVLYDGTVCVSAFTSSHIHQVYHIIVEAVSFSSYFALFLIILALTISRG